VASRRAAEEWIRAGRVTVNGKTAQLGESADPVRDLVCVDGERLEAEALEYWMVNKPVGVLSTVRDPEGRAAILELAPERRGRLFPVGRLDRDTEGLVLLTNDGPLTHAMLHPSHQVEREYVVRVRGRMRERELQRLAAGVELEDGRTAPTGVDRVTWSENETLFHLTMIEGRKRQIRRTLLVLGHPVRRLQRVRMGTLRIGRLAPGEARRLSQREVSALLREAGLAGSHARSSGAKRAQRRRKPRTSNRTRK
jgi:23S rRNA pseudouridine2605 synthase